MSYKALLFCPDEASARVVTQVLSDLDFTVELSLEPFATVKKLSEETYDALVVDCTDQQSASVLFKGARSSNLNHSSLCVAVAEGQAGLANAFRIGANLVLTKPINIEQSKNTLRVARGLLRKNSPQSHSASAPTQPKPTPSTIPPMSTGVTASPVKAPSVPSAPVAPAVPAMAAPMPAPSMPSSLLEAEEKRSQATPSAPPASSIFASAPRPASTPTSFNSSSAGFGAAPALAPERTDHAPAAPAETKPLREVRTAPPMVTHDPIVPETNFPEKPHTFSAPSFGSYARRPAAQSSGNKALWIVPCLLIAGAAGFFGWKKYQPMQYLHRHTGTNATIAQPPAPSPDVAPEPPQTASSPVLNTPTPAAATPSAPDSAALTPSTPGPSLSATNTTAAEGFPAKEHIDVSAPPPAPEKSAPVAKPQAVQVNRQVSRKATPAPVAQEQPAPAPPALVITGNNPADSTIAGLVSTNAQVPKAMPRTLRISQGITQGLLIKRVPPAYPSAALQLRREGTVELLATINKEGLITNVKVLSGDKNLSRAAVDAVKQWQYRPYLLNGEPVEIETQISMIFKLPH